MLLVWVTLVMLILMMICRTPRNCLRRLDRLPQGPVFLGWQTFFTWQGGFLWQTFFSLCLWSHFLGVNFLHSRFLCSHLRSLCSHLRSLCSHFLGSFRWHFLCSLCSHFL